MQTPISTIYKTFFAGCFIKGIASCNSNPTTSTISIKDSSITQNKQGTLKPTMPAPD